MTFAQDDSSTTSEKNFWYGFKFGLDASSKTTTFESIQDQLKGNYQIGAFMQFGRKLYFQPEIYYASYSVNSDSGSTSSIGFVKAPLLVGLQLFDIGLVSAHINAGTTYVKQLANTETSSYFKWTIGVGANVLGFINADIRYLFNNNIDVTEVQDVITNGGTVNLTVGLRL